MYKCEECGYYVMSITIKMNKVVKLASHVEGWYTECYACGCTQEYSQSFGSIGPYGSPGRVTRERGLKEYRDTSPRSRRVLTDRCDVHERYRLRLQAKGYIQLDQNASMTDIDSAYGAHKLEKKLNLQIKSTV